MSSIVRQIKSKILIKKVKTEFEEN